MRRLMASDVPSRPVEPAADENFDIFADEDDQQVRRLSSVSQFPLKIKFHNSFCNNKVRFLLNTITTCPVPTAYPKPTHYQNLDGGNTP